MPQAEYLSTWGSLPADPSAVSSIGGFPTQDANAVEAKLKEAHSKCTRQTILALIAVSALDTLLIAVGALYTQLIAVSALHTQLWLSPVSRSEVVLFFSSALFVKAV